MVSLVNMENKLQAYDVQAMSPAGRIHFQVIALEGKSFDFAKDVATDYIKFAKDATLIGVVKTGSTQGPQLGQEDEITKNGFCIYKLQGCPENKPVTAEKPATETSTSE